VGKPEGRLRSSTGMERRGMGSSSSGQGLVAVINLLVPYISGNFLNR
jgi:hypothetical protein